MLSHGLRGFCLVSETRFIGEDPAWAWPRLSYNPRAARPLGPVLSRTPELCGAVGELAILEQWLLEPRGIIHRKVFNANR
jgi:hypothetical protein